MGGCCADGCANRSENKKLYSVPSGEKNKARREVWLARIKRENFNPSRSARLCEVHFEKSQFEELIPGKLKPFAVPSLFRPLPASKPARSQKRTASIHRPNEGKPSQLYDKDNPDWTPSLLLGYEKSPLESTQLNGQQQEKKETKVQISSSDCVRPSPAQLDQLTTQLSFVVLNKPTDETMTQLVQSKDGDGCEGGKDKQAVNSHFTRKRQWRPGARTSKTEDSNPKRVKLKETTTTDKNETDSQRRMVDLDVFLSSLKLSSLPAGWVWPDRKQPSFVYLHRCKGEGYQQWTVTRQVELSDDATYTLLIHGRPVSQERFPGDWPPLVESSDALFALLECVSEARICAGNPEEEYCRLVSGEVPENAWDSHGMTVRASGCHLLSTEWYQCSPCQELREKLHQIVDSNCLQNCAPVPSSKAAAPLSRTAATTVNSGTPAATVDANDQPERLPFTLAPAKGSEIVFDEGSPDSAFENKVKGDGVLMQALPLIVKHALGNMTAEQLKEPLVVRQIVQSGGGVKKDEKVYLVKDIVTLQQDKSGS